MDFALAQGNATIVAFISGDASFYTSTGALSAESARKSPERRRNSSFLSEIPG